MPTDPSTGDSTGQAGVVASVTGGTPPTQPVNPAQTFQQQQSSQQIAEISALTAKYEQRLSNLMSEKDRMAHERNQAISQLTALQEEHTRLQEQTQSSLSGAANAAQQAIDRTKSLEAKIAELEGESLRARTLLEKPHLAAYAQFIPTSTDPEKVKAAVEQLEQIRRQDLERNGGYSHQQQPGQPSQPGQSGQPPLYQQQQQQVANLYQNRPTMPFQFGIPGSTPAQMNPAGLSPDPTTAIQQLFDDAKKSGDPAAFEQAVRQAATLSQTAIREQLGRSS